MKNIRKGILVFCVIMASFLFFLIPLGARTQELNNPFGINAFVLNRYGWQEWDQPISNIKDIRSGWTREEFVWKQIEPEKGKYNWDFYDQAFSKLKSSNINILGIIDYSAPWATENSGNIDSDKYMPNLDDWRNYVGKIVDRYGGEVKYWQIWNEPNLSIFFKPEPDAEKYSILLKEAYRVIKSKDSGAKVLMAGLSGVDTGYMQQLKNYGAENYIDILAFHPYSFDFVSPPENKLSEDLKNAQKISNDFGGKKVWFTEFGWPTENGSGVSEDLQAKYLLRTYLLSLTFPVVEKIFWYDLRDDGGDENYREHNFGLLNRDYTKKQSYSAYKNMTSLIGGSIFEKVNINGVDGVYDLLFNNNGKKIRVIWKINGESNINIEDPNLNIRVFDYLGRELLSGKSINKNITISGFPIFIVDYENALAEVSYGQSYEYEYIDQSPYLSLKSGEEREIWLKIKNTGTAVWRRDGPNPLFLGTCHTTDRNSSFYSEGNWASPNRPVKIAEEFVGNGEIATFIFKIKANQISNGFYKEYFCPVVDGITWMKDIGVYWGVEVNNFEKEDSSKNSKKYSYEYIEQTPFFSLVKSEKKQLALKIKNTGTENWEKGEFNLGTSRRKDRISIFNQGWEYENRVLLDQDIVKPGEIGSFTFDFTAPQETGFYKEYFRPVVEGMGWLTDMGIYWQVAIN